MKAAGPIAPAAPAAKTISTPARRGPANPLLSLIQALLPARSSADASVAASAFRHPLGEGGSGVAAVAPRRRLGENESAVAAVAHVAVVVAYAVAAANRFADGCVVVASAFAAGVSAVACPVGAAVPNSA